MDNLTIDPDTGDILAGCHPNAMKLLVYNPKDPPGSEVSSYTSLSSQARLYDNLLRQLGRIDWVTCDVPELNKCTYGKSKDFFRMKRYSSLIFPGYQVPI